MTVANNMDKKVALLTEYRFIVVYCSPNNPAKTADKAASPTPIPIPMVCLFASGSCYLNLLVVGVVSQVKTLRSDVGAVIPNECK